MCYGKNITYHNINILYQQLRILIFKNFLHDCWTFAGDWRTVCPVADILLMAFGCFLLASGYCIHFLGFAGLGLDVCRGLAGCMSSDGHFSNDFWMFSSGFWVLHPLSWLYGGEFGCLQGVRGPYVQRRIFPGRRRSLHPTGSFSDILHPLISYIL